MPRSLRRLRIAFVVHAYARHKGHSRYVVELAERFAREHDVHVFANSVETTAPPEIRFHHVPACTWRAVACMVSFVLPATLAVQVSRFDIVHSQGLCALRQDVTTAHMCQAHWFEAVERAQGVLTLRQKIGRALLVPLEWLTYRSWISPEVIAISEANRRDLAGYYGRAESVTIVRHGVDLERFHPERRLARRDQARAELGVGADDVVALYVGDPKKGAASALRAVARTYGVSLVLVSPASPGPWRALAQELGLGSRAVFRSESKEIERELAAADLLLFPTIHDAFGLVITEAMAAGLPVITSCAAGAAELIEPGVDGLLVRDATDDREIAAALSLLARDPELRASVGRAARQKAERFSWDRTAAETMDVYRRVLAARR